MWSLRISTLFATAEALTLLGERMAIELLGRRGAEGRKEYAAVIAPIWISVLFGQVPEEIETRHLTAHVGRRGRRRTSSTTLTRSIRAGKMKRA